MEKFDIGFTDFDVVHLLSICKLDGSCWNILTGVGSVSFIPAPLIKESWWVKKDPHSIEQEPDQFRVAESELSIGNILCGFGRVRWHPPPYHPFLASFLNGLKRHRKNIFYLANTKGLWGMIFCPLYMFFGIAKTKMTFPRILDMTLWVFLGAFEPSLPR